MLYRKIIFSVFLSVLLGLIASAVSYDFDNYSNYAEPDHIEKTIDRFYTEPVFPLAILLFQLFGITADFSIRIFIIFSAFLIIYSLLEISNEKNRFSFIRSLIVTIAASSSILFSIVVPRQGLATGFVLLSIVLIKKNHGLQIWKPMVLIISATITHSAIGLFGAGMIFLGYLNIRKTTLVYILFMSILVIFIIIFTIMFSRDYYTNLLLSYGQYIQDPNETGRIRIIFFLIISVIYVFFPRFCTGGYFGSTAMRNHIISITLSLTMAVLYFIVSAETIRFSYIITLIMIGDLSNRIRFYRWSLLFNSRN